MTDQQLERCKKYLRSTLLSNKGGVPAHELNRHYMDLVGEGIPYTQFNFRTLEDFLTSMPDVCQICWSGKDWVLGGRDWVIGVADSATQHIEKMVAQNTKKRGKRGRSRQANFPAIPPPRSRGGVSDNGFSSEPPRFGGGGASISVLQLEIEELKDNMNSVQSEIVTCMASLSLQHDRISGVVNRLESVSAIVKAMNRNEENHVSKISCSSIELTKVENENCNTIDNTTISATSNEVNPVLLNISPGRMSEPQYPQSNIKEEEIKESNGKGDSVVGKDDNRTINVVSDKCFDILSTTRPSITKKIRAKSWG